MKTKINSYILDFFMLTLNYLTMQICNIMKNAGSVISV